MWIGDKVYFASDRDGTLNLYAYDLDSRKTVQLTSSKDWDVRWPSRGNEGQIVYELNGELQVLDTKTGKSSQVPIHVPTDAVAARPSRVAAERFVEDFELSPKGERALFVARGEIFTVPIEKGSTRNLSQSSNAHEKLARWSPDGSRIAYISDVSGEEEIYVISQDGNGKPEQLTQGGKAMRYAPEWSPDGKRLAFSDKDGKLFVLTIADKLLINIADEKRGQVRDYSWSPDGQYLAFSLSEPSEFRSLYIWSVALNQLHRVTDEYFNEYHPVWDPEGKYLYYLSDREFAPQLGSFEWNYLVTTETGVFVLALSRETASPFPPESDEVTVEKEQEEKQEQKPEESKSKSLPIVRIDFEGLSGRVSRVPAPADNYSGLSAIKGHLLYVRGGAPFYGRETDRKPALYIYSLKDRKETLLAENISNYAVSADGSKVLVREEQSYHLYKAAPDGKSSKKTLNTREMMTERDPRREWAQIFEEVWRRFRDFFYVENMHGYDWEGLRRRYRPWLEHVAHRSDLNYLLGEMVAELNVSHAYIAGGDFEIPERPQLGLLGARLELDVAAGRYKISRIYPGHNEEERYRSPLTEVGVSAREGDYLLAIDGRELSGNDNPYQLLRYKANRVLQLALNDRPVLEGARTVTIRPISTEVNLHYLSWVTHNLKKVTEATGGKVGYLHLPDMGADGIREFIKWYYPQIPKEGLIIDVRYNGGGNVSQMIIERLRRQVLGTVFSRTREDADTYPTAAFHGHLVCILNENSASDGDLFSARFKEAGLGPLIGKRSWGGVIGITNRGPLVDGGTVNVPEFGHASARGEWIIEGYGVDPDIVVENDPALVIAGRDPQLEKAIEVITEMIQKNPKKLPARPADPIRTQ